MKRVMFVCKRNSCLSQMAEAFAWNLGKRKIVAESSGLEKSEVDPLAIDVMFETGTDIGDYTSKPLSYFNPKNYDIVISLCGLGINLPEEWMYKEVFENWQIDDPEGQDIQVFRNVRDQIKQRVEKLVESLS